MRKLKKITRYLVFIILFFSLNCTESTGKMSLGKFTKLTMENNPEIGGVAVLKIVFSSPIDVPKVDIYCFLPEPLEMVGNKEYEVTYQESFTGEVGNKVILWSGSVRGGEKKEFLLRVKVPDGRKHIVDAGGIEESDYLEIDLGEPEPPESKSQNKENISSDEEMPSIPTGIKQSIGGKCRRS